MYFKQITYPQIIIISALVIFLLLASFWEFKDYKRIKDRPYLCDIKSKRERRKELEFYACYNSNNNVQWRGIFIMTFVSTFLITYLVSQFYPDQCIDINLVLLIFGAILLTFYIGNIFKTYHLYRDMSCRVMSDKML